MKKDKMAERLTELQVCDLVNIYKEHECLWDVSNEFYKNREARDKAYVEIKNKLNIPGLKAKDIPQKIKNLRTSYFAELRKIEASRKKGGKVYRPKVPWFSNADEFLQGATRSQLISAESESESEPLSKIRQDCAQKSKATSEKKEREVPQSNNDDSDDDEFDSYGKYLAFSLRSMPSEMSIIARLELQKTIADVQLRALRKRNARQLTRPVKCRPSTSKMDEDPLHDPLDNLASMESESSCIKTEEEEIL